MHITSIIQLCESLKGVKHLSGKRWYEIVDYLEEQGFVEKQGHFGSAFIHPSKEYVYKVFENDDAYLRFLEYCQNANSIHLPRVYRVYQVHAIHERPVISKDKLWIATVEKLHKLPNPLLNYFDENLKNIVYDFVFHQSKVARAEYFTYDGVDYLKDKMDISWDNLWRIFGQYDLKGLVEDAGKIVKATKMALDTHGSNVMQRADGTLVLTDPVFDVDSVTQQDFRASFHGHSTKRGPVYK